MHDLRESGLLHDPGAIYLQSFSLESLAILQGELVRENATLPMTWLLDCSAPLPSNETLDFFSQFGTALGSAYHRRQSSVM